MTNVVETVSDVVTDGNTIFVAVATLAIGILSFNALVAIFKKVRKG